MEPFQPCGSTGHFGTGYLRRDLWMRPNPELTSACDIFEYAISFDGYAYAHDMLRMGLHDRVRPLRKKWNGPGRAEMDFVELRLLLFWEQRRFRHSWVSGALWIQRKDDPEERVLLEPGSDEVPRFSTSTGRSAKPGSGSGRSARRYLDVDR